MMRSMVLLSTVRQEKNVTVKLLTENGPLIVSLTTLSISSALTPVNISSTQQRFVVFVDKGVFIFQKI